tara:strand:- start:453 stop:1598 length:1146 start_codon:yes stop_codon:yes gene_type:complete
MGFAVTSYAKGPIGILSARIVSLDQTLNFPESITQLAVDEERYEMFKTPATNTDSKILSKYVDPINAAKQEVVNTGTSQNFFNNNEVYATGSAAISKLDSIYGDPLDITTGDGLYSERDTHTVFGFTGNNLGPDPHPPSGNFSAGIAVTQHATGAEGVLTFDFSASAGSNATMYVRNVSGSFNTGIANTLYFGAVGSGVGYTGPDTINFIASAKIYNDVDVMHIHPNLEPPDPGTQDIFAGSKNVILDSSNHGIGFANTFYPNGLNTTTSQPIPDLGSFVNCDPTPPLMGEVFTFDTSSGSSQNSTISDKRQIIKDLRMGNSSDPNDVGVGSYNGASAVIKNQKRSHAINTWSGKRMRVVAGEDKASFQAAIDILSDPEFQ